MVTRLLRIPAAVLVVALAVLSWMPAIDMARTGMSGRLEHLLAYAATTVAVGLGFRSRPRQQVQCALLILYAAILEAGQLYAPGRNATFTDFAFSTTGVLLGGVGLALARRRFGFIPK